MHEKGFTLIELIMGLVILSLLLALTLPRFNAVLDNLRLRADARQLAQVLRNARLESICLVEDHSILFYPFADQYKDERNKKNYTLQEGITYLGTTSFQASPPRCTFHPSGAASPAGTVTLKNKQGKIAKVVVNPVMGRIRIEYE